MAFFMIDHMLKSELEDRSTGSRPLGSACASPDSPACLERGVSSCPCCSLPMLPVGPCKGGPEQSCRVSFRLWGLARLAPPQPHPGRAPRLRSWDRGAQAHLERRGQRAALPRIRLASVARHRHIRAAVAVV